MKRKFLKGFLAIALTATTLISASPIATFAVEENANYEAALEASDGAIIPMPYTFEGTAIHSPLKKATQSSYDPRTLGLTSPVKNQMNLGTCWDFASVANLEHHLLKEGESVSDFSEEHVRWWAMEDSNGIGWDRTDDDGGNSIISSGYYTSWVGPKAEADLPYYGYEGGTKPSNFATAKVQKHVTDIAFISGDEQSVKEAILKYGSVDTAYYHSDSYYNSSTAGYYCNKSNLSSNHEVLVVGWDDNYSKSNFKTQPSSNGAWLVKNSWDSDWGDGGYFWVSYEDKYFLNDNYTTNVCFTGVEDVKDNQKIYQYDPYGIINLYTVSSSKSLGFANVYDFSDGYNQLDEVMFMTESEGATYEIAYAPYTNSTIDLSSKVVLGTGTVDHSGYTTAKLDTPYVMPTGKGAIIVTLDGTSAGVVAGIGDEESYSGLYTAEANKGESFYINGTTVTDINKSITSTSKGKSLSIKAITSAAEGTTPVDPTPDPDPVDPDPTPTLSSDASLESLLLGSTEAVDYISSSNTVSATISRSTTSLTITADANDDGAKVVSINGKSVAANSGSVKVTLSRYTSSFSIPVVVQAEDGTTATYTIKLTRRSY